METAPAETFPPILSPPGNAGACRAALARAAGRRHDVIVIGGGINGAGIARDAAMRGLSVLLLERHDYGFGTTWRSTKLIHGGLRYLEHRELGLVYEALHERAILLRTAPHLVKPLQLLIPVYRGGRYGPLMIRAGLALYDVLSIGKTLPHHRALSPAGVAAQMPAVAQGGLQGGFTYYDAQVALPERLCLENILSAQAHGAAVFNYVTVTGFDLDAGTITGVHAHDTLTDTTLTFQGRCIINASGPWVDHVLATRGTGNAPQPDATRYVAGTKGSHIVVDFAGDGPDGAIYAEAGSDGRPFFIIPWRGAYLIGTTDIPFTGDPATVIPTAEEVAYLRAETARILPALPITDAQIRYAFAGIRPLQAPGTVPPHKPAAARSFLSGGRAAAVRSFLSGGRAAAARSFLVGDRPPPPTPPPPGEGSNIARLPTGGTGAVSRRHFLHDHARDGAAGLLSVVGGKLTSYRSLAAQAVTWAERRMGRPVTAVTTDRGPLVPGIPFPMMRDALHMAGTSTTGIPEQAARTGDPAAGTVSAHLAGIYGPRAGAVLALCRLDPALRAPLCPHGPDIAAQVIHAARHEGAQTVADVLLRRTPCGWNPCRGLDAAPAVARLLAREYHWPDDAIEAAIAAYTHEVNATLLPVAACR